MMTYLHNHLEHFLANTFADVYWKDRDGKYLGANDIFLKVSGMSSEKDVIGSTDLDQIWHEQAPLMMKNDKTIVTNECVQTWIETAKHPNGKIVHYLSHKSPLRNRGGKVIGSFGLSYGFETQDWNVDKLNEVNMVVGTTGVEHIKRYLLTLQRDKHQLSKRQVECLYYLTKGKTYRQIAQILGISNRTVEHYIDTIKAKMNCQNKSELIEKYLQSDFI